MKKKNIAIIVVVACIIILSSVVLYEKANEPLPGSRDPYYEYYIDYGNHETDTLQNGWIGKSTNVKNPLFVLQELTNAIVDSDGRIISINGVAPDQNAGERWVIWKYDHMAYYDDYSNRWVKMDAMPQYVFGMGTDYYLGLTQVNPVTNIPSLNPNNGGIEATQPTDC
ncbi:hypothetical protein Mpt1_c02510 [Candidatus Methanoplasma termitum]|uniref:Uncharacterized protein n=1 Tax=Candidatus Methanoplasma termitum TaxID=1577791 RepID=A0A0A7LF86_9ARCH|nr:hypothetical protein [Candidatus Methanoplasma termitum]AIZ56151.1 hypothetical protein Mpt1_c02510 [Candidatus Methanoplasma termitum]